MITVDTFLVVEEAISSLVWREASRLLSPKFKEAEEYVSQGQFLKARAVISSLSLASLFSSDDEPLLYLTNVAMLFGASMVSQQPGTSVVGLGFEATTSKQMVLSFLQMVRQKAEVFLKEKGLRLLTKLQAASSLDGVVEDLTQRALKADTRILRSFGSFMDSSGKAFFNIASSLHTSRVSAYGFTAEAAAMGYEEYQLNEQLDSRTCPVCRLMHGKTFRVSEARNLLKVVTRTSDPDDLKSLQPWPSQTKENLKLMAEMSPQELVAKGWHIPPFHPRCRGLLGRIGKVPSQASLDSPPPTTPYTVGPSDFKALGVKPSKALVSAWSKNLTISPAELVARLQGKTTDSLLESLLGAKSPAKVAGIKKFSLGGDDSLAIWLEGSGFLANGMIKQKLGFDFSTKNLLLDEVVFPKNIPPHVFKAYMVEAYSVTKDAGLTSLSVATGSGYDGFAFAKYGFKPSVTEWAGVQSHVKEKIDAIGMTAFLNDAQAKILTAILNSTDPGEIFTLSDCPFGEFLLSGSSWVGTLNVKDSESVVRFLTYLGALS